MIPQLSKSSSILKDNSNYTSPPVNRHFNQASSQAPSIINISNINNTNKLGASASNVVTQATNFKSVDGKQLELKAGPTILHKSPKLKVIDYVSELKLINNYLKLKNHVEGVLNEVKTIAGKCYLCENKGVFDLLHHFKFQHFLTINSKCFESVCLLCGQSVQSRENLIAHQFEVHKIISFVSLNKVFTMTKIESQSTERKKIEERINELKVAPGAAQITPIVQSKSFSKLNENSSKVEALKGEDDVKVKNPKLNYKRPNTISAITAALEAESNNRVKSSTIPANIEATVVSFLFLKKIPSVS